MIIQTGYCVELVEWTCQICCSAALARHLCQMIGCFPCKQSIIACKLYLNAIVFLCWWITSFLARTIIWNDTTDIASFSLRMMINQTHLGIHIDSWWSAELMMTCIQWLPQCWWWLMMKHDKSGLQEVCMQHGELMGCEMLFFIGELRAKFKTWKCQMRMSDWHFSKISVIVAILYQSLMFGIAKYGSLSQKCQMSGNKSNIDLTWTQYLVTELKKCQISHITYEASNSQHEVELMYMYFFCLCPLTGWIK